MLDGEQQVELPAPAAMPVNVNAGIMQSFVRPNLNAWERLIKTFVRKTQFVKVFTLQDKLDAFSIYGGEEIETLIETLPDPDDGDVNLPADVKLATEAVNEYHRRVFKLTKISKQW